MGLSGWGGGLSSSVVCPVTSLYHIPDNVSMEAGALVEPLAVGWHAVKMSPMQVCLHLTCSQTLGYPGIPLS